MGRTAERNQRLIDDDRLSDDDRLKVQENRGAGEFRGRRRSATWEGPRKGTSELIPRVWRIDLAGGAIGLAEGRKVVAGVASWSRGRGKNISREGQIGLAGGPK